MNITDTKIAKAGFDCSTWTRKESIDPAEFYAQITDRDGKTSVMASSRKSEKLAREKLGHCISYLALKQKRAERNSQRAIIVTGGEDNEILIVSWRFDCWEYSIIRKGAKHASGVTGNWKDFDEACAAARKHAADFGPILWEARL